VPIRNHPYVAGNKRIGLVAMVAFLDRNGYDLIASDVEVVGVVVSVAAGGRTGPASPTGPRRARDHAGRRPDRDGGDAPGAPGGVRGSDQLRRRIAIRL
jgi:hypothetical protein